MPKKPARCSPLVAIALFVLVRRAYGYVDPGTGSYVLQVMLGLLFAAAFTLKIYWRHVVGFFRAKLGRKRDTKSPEK